MLVVLLIAGAVIGGVLYNNAQKNETAGQVIEPASVSASYPVRRDGVVVVAGKDDAKVTIDIYEDFLCPFCREFEAGNAAAIESKLADGTLRARYHVVTILNELSDPPGYSLDAANAAVCAADAGGFPAFYASLFRAQPEEGARGYDKAQLTRLGTDLRITSPDFSACVESGRFNADLQSATGQAGQTPHLLKDRGDGNKSFGTPTVATGERLIDITDPNWLTNLTASATSSSPN